MNMVTLQAFLQRAKSVTWHSILLGLRPHYQRLAAWWQEHLLLQQRLKAFRGIVADRAQAMRRATIGGAMVVMTGQVQSRAELRQLTPEEIMDAWRAGRLDYLLGNADEDFSGYRAWVGRGGFHQNRRIR